MKIDPREQLDAFLAEELPGAERSTQLVLRRIERGIKIEELAQLMERRFVMVPLFEQRLTNIWDEWVDGPLDRIIKRSAVSGGDAQVEAGVLDFDTIPDLEVLDEEPIAKDLPDAAVVGVLSFIESHKRFLRQHFGRQTAVSLVEILQTAARNHQWGAGTVARDLRGLVTLTPSQTRALARRYETDRRKGVSAVEARRNLKEHEQRLRNLRANRIAQHEVAQMWNQGALQSVKARVRTGEIERGVQKVWLTVADERVCPICRPLHKATSDVDGTFTSTGFMGQAPPGHIYCRCALAYIRQSTRVQVVSGLDLDPANPAAITYT